MRNNNSEKQICPKCKSEDIQTDFSNHMAVATGALINTKKCNNCGYFGTFFPIIKNKNIAKKNKKTAIIKKANCPFLNILIKSKLN